MNRTVTKRLLQVMVLLFLTVFAASSFAAVFNVQAGTTTVTMPDGTSITMWGFGLNGGPITVPGPVLEIPPADSSLTIHVTNNLPAPVSIVIPGQPATLSPVRFTDSSGRSRVRSFTNEIAPGNTGTYTWTNLKPGTYLYESGTHVAVQVQMGLYGAMKKDAGLGEAYAGVPYDNEVILLYSEIDPALHAAVAGGTYGTASYPSTIDYRPKYFLVNGQPFPNALPVLKQPVSTQDLVLFRFLNAGLQTHVPSINGTFMRVISEDGNLYPYPKEQYSVALTAGKTMDAIWTPVDAKTYPVYDRRFFLTNGDVSPGGMLVYVTVAAPCRADLDGDKDVDAVDLSIFLADFGRTDCDQGPPCEGDFNGDNSVDMADLLVFISEFGRTDCP